MSYFGDLMDVLAEAALQPVHGIAITLHYVDGTTDAVTATIVEDVGANDPFAERTFVVVVSQLTGDPDIGDYVTHDGDADAVRWVIQKVRDTDDGHLEVRTRSPETRGV